jgi:hypothetical protein
MNRQLLQVFSMSTLLSFSVACGNKSQDLHPFTGGAKSEVLLSASLSTMAEVNMNQDYYISTTSLRVRSTPAITSDNILGTLNFNDRVRVISTTNNEPFVEIEILRTSSSIANADRYFISYQYLATNPGNSFDLTGQYFMVQNIASETLRVYKRVCENSQCHNQLALQTPMVSGEDEEGTRSIVGTFRITSWEKFYQDYAGNYPSWYHPSYPATPEPGQGLRGWSKRSVMPVVDGKRRGSFRGAFGWYAAKVGPNHNAQWTHGTYGWGHESADFIERTRGFMVNLVASPRSNGCTRVDNLTVAYLREILPVGTPVIRLYAVEQFLNMDSSFTPVADGSWDYILTKRDARRINGETADRNKVIARGVTFDEILEEGTYVIKRTPTITQMIPGENLNRFFSIRNPRASKDSGNVYAIPGASFRGVFYVDAGLVRDYAHPIHEKIRVGGFSNIVVPDFMKY